MAKILVADDNSNIQKMVGLALKDQGIDVVAVGNGEAAVRKISDVHPDLVLADVFMPVRNGYEVCRYVKEDSALSHIPVILLVGAFDPLDEQEAQRVGADGVLKKPFVPPDPLISMVKSALTRAGVPLGPPPSSTPAPDKTPIPGRTGADILRGAVSKLPSPLGEKLPEATPEPVEEFPAPPPQVKIPEGAGPLAFGNLLGSAETEEEAVFSSKPMINISGKEDWDEPKEVPEDEDAEESRGGWRPSGLDEPGERAASPSASAPDWRDEAFHGSAPGKTPSSNRWTPTAEKTAIVEAAEAETPAVATLDDKPSNGHSPFANDAWAAAMAHGVEQKLVQAEAIAPPVVAPEPESTPAQSSSAPAHETFATPPVEQKPPEPEAAPAVPETSWEAEAKRAAMLASTWDATPAPTPDDTQDVPVYIAEQTSAETDHALEAPSAEPTAYSAHFEPEPAAAVEPAPQDKIHEPANEGNVPKSWENAWEAPANVSSHFTEPEPVAETPVAPEPPVEPAPHLHAATETPVEAHAAVEPEPPQAFEPPAAAPQSFGHVSVPAVEPEPEPAVISQPFEHLHAPVAEPAHAAELQPAQPAPNMDELVARVLAKMNPEVLQKVTHEILKPVIEAIVRDELDSKNK